MLIIAAVDTFFRGLRRNCVEFVALLLFSLPFTRSLLNLGLIFKLEIFLFESDFSATLTGPGSSEIDARIWRLKNVIEMYSK